MEFSTANSYTKYKFDLKDYGKWSETMNMGYEPIIGVDLGRTTPLENDLRDDRYERGIAEGSYPTHITYSNLD